MDREAQRHKEQLEFSQSGQDIVIGNESILPLSVKQLQSIQPDSDYVVEAHTGGLTAHVYHIQLNGRDWNLKVKRPESLVKNIDGQTSFLNEVQRRRDFQALKNDPSTAAKFAQVVETDYASFQQGIMLSPWIHGQLVNSFDERILTQLFETLVNFELNGIIEWDLCPGNVIDDGKDVWLFDFGYCFRFDPLTEFNSCGLKVPMFHSVERLESRNFFGYLLKQESHWRSEQILALFELEKRLALQAYQRKFAELKQRGASATVLAWQAAINDRWQQALSSKVGTEELMLLEGFRSHLLDVHDDVSGQSCTPMTLKRLDKIEQVLAEHFDLLKARDGLFFGDEDKTQQQLLAHMATMRAKAKQYQLA